MKLVNLRWITPDEGRSWSLVGNGVSDKHGAFSRRRLFVVTYIGSTRAADWADRKQRWEVNDLRFWLEDPQEIHEFKNTPVFTSAQDAKAWVDAIVRLS